jgi:glyoxylase-like metal-dependent hydrolase (beta-lactamase superfamily II)
MNVETIDRGIYATTVTLDDFEVRGALVVGDTCAVVWDTLSRPQDMALWPPLIGDRELAIVYSHADWDHIWGTAGLPYRSARIVAHSLTTARFGTDVPGKLTSRQSAEPGQWQDVVLVPPTESFERDWSMDLGGMTLSLHPLPGHTADCIVGFIPERGVLLAGDTVETPCPVVPADSPLPAWIAELRRWAGDARVRTVIPAHGPIGGRELLERNVVYLEGIRNGQPIAPPGPLTAFYGETHAKNVRWSADGRPQGPPLRIS